MHCVYGCILHQITDPLLCGSPKHRSSWIVKICRLSCPRTHHVHGHCTTKITHLLLHDTTMVQNDDSKAQIIIHPCDFYVGHFSRVICSQRHDMLFDEFVVTQCSCPEDILRIHEDPCFGTLYLHCGGSTNWWRHDFCCASYAYGHDMWWGVSDDLEQKSWESMRIHALDLWFWNVVHPWNNGYMILWCKLWLQTYVMWWGV